MFYRSSYSYRDKKGFSLVELLVVIAIIGILAAVGITAYSGYTANAKVKATTAQNKDIINLLNSEFAKCAAGEGTFSWSTTVTVEFEGAMIDETTPDSCAANPVEASIVTYINSALGLKNPYATADGSAVGGTTPTLGQTAIDCTGANCAVVSETEFEVETTIVTVSGY